MSEDLEATDQCVCPHTEHAPALISGGEPGVCFIGWRGDSVVSHTSELLEGFGGLWITELTSAAPAKGYLCQTQQLVFLESSGGGC